MVLKDVIMMKTKNISSGSGSKVESEVEEGSED